MKKWLRRTLIAALVVGLTLAALYEAATHVGRGWLRGEAFYEGRPSPYWRRRIDEWMERCGSPEASVHSMDFIYISEPNLIPIRPSVNMVFVLEPIPDSWACRLQKWPGGNRDPEGDPLPPKVLWGLVPAEPALLELATDTAHRSLALRALENVKITRQLDLAGGEPILQFGFSNRWAVGCVKRTRADAPCPCNYVVRPREYA